VKTTEGQMKKIWEKNKTDRKTKEEVLPELESLLGGAGENMSGNCPNRDSGRRKHRRLV